MDIRSHRPWIPGLALVLLASPLAAVDGVLEVAQACVADGCFPGDGPGFPVEIIRPGSYRLTGDLVVPDAASTAISIAVSGATLDLNGFGLRGVVVCSGVPLQCAPAGTGRGVDAAGMEHVIVRNGEIRGFGDSGVAVGPLSLLEDLQLTSNGGDGARLGFMAEMRRCASSSNGGRGVSGDLGAVVRDSRFAGNAGAGVGTLVGSVVERNISRSNEGDGIVAGAGSRIDGNDVQAHSSGTGLMCPGGSCRIADNRVTGNGTGIACGGPCQAIANQVFSNSGAGIALSGAGGLLTSNWVASNGGVGLDLNATAGYRENVMQDNSAGEVNGGVNLGANLCGPALCP